MRLSPLRLALAATALGFGALSIGGCDSEAKANAEAVKGRDAQASAMGGHVAAAPGVAPKGGK